MNITTERWSRSICFLLGMGIIVRSYDAHFRSYLVRKLEQKVSVGLGSKNALRDPRERKNKQKKAVQEVFVGRGDENALRDPSKQSKLEETRRKSRIKKPARVSETKMDWETREGRK